MRKGLITCVSAVELLLLAGAYITNYFTVRKLGMVRFINYYVNKWEAAYPLTLIKFGALLALMILTVLAIVTFVHRKGNRSFFHFLMCAMTMVLMVAYAVIVCGRSVSQMRAYYFVILMVGIAAILQWIKTELAMLSYRKPVTDKGEESERKTEAEMEPMTGTEAELSADAVSDDTMELDQVNPSDL